jgi:indole-3-glycerol phosphate synthase
MNAPLPDALARICARTRETVADRRSRLPVTDIQARIASDGYRPRGFADALPGLIAELKRASPSAGTIRPDFDAGALAATYERAGSACLSVLTEASEFRGSLDDLAAARSATNLPVLRKDFMLEPWQIWESRLAHADCVLLIVACLEDSMLSELDGLARSLGLDVLVEVHDEAELSRALAHSETPLVGINNRDLRSLRTDLATTARLAPLVPAGRILVSESGIKEHRDLIRLSEYGASSFLVGESLLRQHDLGAATRALLGA